MNIFISAFLIMCYMISCVAGSKSRTPQDNLSSLETLVHLLNDTPADSRLAMLCSVYSDSASISLYQGDTMKTGPCESVFESIGKRIVDHSMVYTVQSMSGNTVTFTWTTHVRCKEHSQKFSHICLTQRCQAMSNCETGMSTGTTAVSFDPTFGLVTKQLTWVDDASHLADCHQQDQKAGVGTKLLFENKKLKVWEMVLNPGDEAPLHTHRYDYVFTILKGSTLDIFNSNGEKTSTIVAEPGDFFPFELDGDTLVGDDGSIMDASHSAVNVGSTVFHELLIETKV